MDEKNNKNFSLDKKIEAILFFKSDEVSLNSLTKILGLKKKEIKEGIEKLRERLEESALFLIESNEKYLLATRPEASNLIEQIKEKEEFSELSNSALETLSIILYKNGATRAELDQIRGVNSTYILRNLLIRGLVEKKSEDGRIFYLPSLNLLSFLGVDSVEKIPSFDEVRKKILEVEERVDENQNENQIITNSENEN